MKPAPIIALAVAIAAGGFSLTTRSPDPILLTEAHATPMGDDETAIFLKIENRGMPDRLISVSSSAGQASLYSPEAVPGPPSPSGTGAELAADGAHIRLSGAAFQDGQLIPVTLTFEQAGPVTAKARVNAPDRPGGHGMHSGHADAAQSVGHYGMGGIHHVEDAAIAPKIALRVTPDGDGWQVRVETENFAFSRDQMGKAHTPGKGHAHLYVGGMKLERLFGGEAHIGALPPGYHQVRVTLNTNDHRAYVVDGTPVSASAVIDVPG